MRKQVCVYICMHIYAYPFYLEITSFREGKQDMDYGELVFSFLKERKYPILEKFIILDIYYKIIPAHLRPQSIIQYNKHMEDPRDAYRKEARPFTLTYLVPGDGQFFYVYHLDQLETRGLQEHCMSLKLSRSYIDNHILNRHSLSFEEEIYYFLTLLNFNVPRIHSVLNLDFMMSTRFLPQRIQLWACHYTSAPIPFRPLSEKERAWFGPPPEGQEVIPTRVLRGRLSECMSRSRILSLNNDYEDPSFQYTHHYAEKWKTLISLAFNPIENPIIVL